MSLKGEGVRLPQPSSVEEIQGFSGENVVLEDVSVTPGILFYLLENKTLEIRDNFWLTSYDESPSQNKERIRKPGPLDVYTYSSPATVLDGLRLNEKAKENIKKMRKEAIHNEFLSLQMRNTAINLFPKLSMETTPQIEFLIDTDPRDLEIILPETTEIRFPNFYGSSIAFSEFALHLLPILKIEYKGLYFLRIKVSEKEVECETQVRELDELRKMEDNTVDLGNPGWISFAGPVLMLVEKMKKSQESDIQSLKIDAQRDVRYSVLKKEHGAFHFRFAWDVELSESAVMLLPRLQETQRKDHRIKLTLKAKTPEVFDELAKKENRSIKVGEIYYMRLENYAVITLFKINIPQGNSRIKISAIIWHSLIDAVRNKFERNGDNEKIYTGTVSCLALGGTDFLLPRIKTSGESDIYHLRIGEKSNHMKPVSGERLLEYKKIRNISMVDDNAHELLPLMKIPEEHTAERLEIFINKKETFEEIMKMENRSIKIGKVDCFELRGRFVPGIIPKLKINTEHTAKLLFIDVVEDDVFEGFLH
ncbi:MAG: uncharacterized protein A8A55_2952, partial [Amphiamblys sp. WSBS2006]